MIKPFLLILTAACLSLLLFLPGCSIKDPIFPAWETNFRIPFAVEDFILGEELVNDSTIIIKDNDPNSVIWVSLNDSIELQEISSRDLSLNLNNGFDAIRLDTLTIDTLEIIAPGEISLRDLMPELSQQIGQTVTIQQATLTVPAVTFSSETFKRVHFLDGIVRVRFVNNLPFAIGPNQTSAGLRAAIASDSLPNDPFAEVQFPETISTGQSAVRETLIADKWLYTPMRFSYELPVAAATSILVTDDLLDNTGISVVFELLNIQTDEIVAALKPQHFDDTIKLDVSTRNQLREAVVDRGRIFLDLTNNIALGANVQYTVPALRDAQDQPFVDAIHIPANQSVRKVLVLDGFRAINITNPGEIIDSLEIEIQAETIASGDILHIRGSDNIAVTVTSESIFFESLSGSLGGEVLTIEPIVNENIFDYGDFDGETEFSEVCLDITVFSEVFVENLTADLTLSAFHENEQGVVTESAEYILNNQQINGGVPGAPGETRIFVSADDRPDLLDIINILPTTLRFEGQISASGDAEIAAGNRIWAQYVVETPIKAKVSNLATFVGDVSVITDTNIDSLVQDVVDENILGADITYNITNNTPLSGAIYFVLTADAADPYIYDAVFDTSMVILDTIAVEPASIDPLTGFVREAREIEISLNLNQREIRLFQNVPLRYGYEFMIDETDEVVTLRYSDFVRIRGEVNTRVLIKDNKE